MEEKNTDDWIRVHVEDHVRMVEERRRLREQVAALQATSAKQCLEIRKLRETTEQWRREVFKGDVADAHVVWACVHKMLDDADAPKESSAAARIGALAAECNALRSANANVNANLLNARGEACTERGKFIAAQQEIDTVHAILDQAGVSRLTSIGSETRRTLVERIEALDAHLREERNAAEKARDDAREEWDKTRREVEAAHRALNGYGVGRVGMRTHTLPARIDSFAAMHVLPKDLDARLNEALAVLDALVKSHTTAAQAESKQRAIELLNKEHGL